MDCRCNCTGATVAPTYSATNLTRDRNLAVNPYILSAPRYTSDSGPHIFPSTDCLRGGVKFTCGVQCRDELSIHSLRHARQCFRLRVECKRKTVAGSGQSALPRPYRCGCGGCAPRGGRV